ncbi:MAG TPA: hypothetical protein VLJ17_10230 [Xanthobacteraceae bacterium]|nr:hypothetical protein [Xanthobacteraceae bacterium]
MPRVSPSAQTVRGLLFETGVARSVGAAKRAEDLGRDLWQTHRG